MKILHVLKSPKAEGTPRLVLDWLKVNHFDHLVFFLEESPNDLLEEFTNEAREVIINKELDSGIKKVYSIIFFIAKIAKSSSPELVIAWNQGNAHLILYGARLGGAKNLIAHAGCRPEQDFFRGFIYNNILNWSLKLINAKVICASNHILNSFKSIQFIPKSIFYKINNCVEIRRFTNPNGQIANNKAIIIANLESYKDHETLIKAWQQVVQKIKNAELLVVGGGSLSNYLQDLSKQLNIHTHIKFLGPRNDVPELLKKASLFVFPSVNEGFGTVLIEALASGLQVIASDISACREVLENGRYGKLTPPQNPEAFAKAIIEAFENPLTENQLQSQIEYTHRFTPENMMRQYLEIAGFEKEVKEI